MTTHSSQVRSWQLYAYVRRSLSVCVCVCVCVCVVVPADNMDLDQPASNQPGKEVTAKAYSAIIVV